MTPYFCKIEVTCKSIRDSDWRAFLYWGDPDTMTLYEIRGYGKTPGEAANQAFERYGEDSACNFTGYSVEAGPWED